MAENHYVDPGDQHIAAEGVEDHSELTTNYLEAKHETLGPWMQEDERQKAFEKDRSDIIKGLRAASVPIGLFVSIPVVLGILIGQFALTSVPANDPNAMAYVIGLIFAVGIAGIITVSLFRWVSRTFYNHSLRALPITLTILACVAFLVTPLFALGNTLIGGLAGYAAGLGGILLAGIVISVLSIFVWTMPKLSGVVKLSFLFLLLGVSVAAQYAP